MAQLKPGAKFFLILVMAGLLFGGFMFIKDMPFMKKLFPEQNQGTQDLSKAPIGQPIQHEQTPVAAQQTPAFPEVPKAVVNQVTTPATTPTTSSAKRPHIRVLVCTWPGYAGGELFNNGFAASQKSRYSKEYGIDVDFILNDDPATTMEMWKTGEVDVMWTTIDAFTTYVDSIKQYYPKMFFQSDFSAGGDVIVSTSKIKSLNDLKGKSIAVTLGSPSHTFLIWGLQQAGLKYSDVNIVATPSAVDAASTFKAGKVDVAVVWSPDDQDCLKSVPGSKVLVSTKQASKIIPAVFVSKKQVLDENHNSYVALVKGWMIGAQEIKTDPVKRHQAVDIMAAGYGLPAEFFENALNQVDLANYADNLNLFGMNPNYKGVTGKELYETMHTNYNQLNMSTSRIPTWDSVVDTTILRDVNLQTQQAAPEPKFTAPTKEMEYTPAIASKMVSISFPSGSAVLDSNGKYIIDKEFAPAAKLAPTMRIRIEGNTDNIGNLQMNMNLSDARAKAVADYLVSEHGFDRNRFITVGNGPNKPIADNNSDSGRAKNRRTDFELLSK